MNTKRVVKNVNSKANAKRAAASDNPPWKEPRGKKGVTQAQVVGAQQAAKAKKTATLKERLKPIEFDGNPAKTKIPKKLNECVDLYEAVRRKRLEIQKQAQEYAALESALREHLIDSIPKSDAAGVTGRTHRVNVIVDTVPTITDEAAFMKAAHRKGNEDLIVEKPNPAAIKERWEAGKAIPGVGSFNIVKLSLKQI